MSSSPRATVQTFATPARYGVVIFLVSLALLNAQVSVTRLLAYRFFYHFVFFVISLSQLGLAAAGAWVYASRKSEWSGRELVRWLLGMGVLPLIVLACYGWLSPQPNLAYAKVDGSVAYAYLGVIAVLLVALNFCGGMAITILFTTFRERIGALYASDLAGAALGCLASVGAMATAGPVRAFLLTGVASAFAALLLVQPKEGAEPAPDSRKSMVAVVLILALLGGGAAWPHVFDPDIRFAHKLEDMERTAWNHLARLDAPKAGRYVIDGDASTDVADFKTAVNESPEYILAAPDPDVAIIGVGAGPQLGAALARGARSVLAIDINPTILSWSMNEDRELNGNMFHHPKVQVVVGEGRHSLRSAEGEFDVIVMHAIDTWTASSQGAYSLTENFLYTSEAMGDFLSKLKPGGVVSIRRWLFSPPRENLRLFTTVLDAVAQSGAERPVDHVVVLSPTPASTEAGKPVVGFLLMSKSPFSAEQLKRLDDRVASQGWGYLYRPGQALDTPFQEYAAASDKADFLATYPYIVTPATDANPFFFQFSPPWSKWTKREMHFGQLYGSSSTLLVLCLLMAVILTIVLLGVPLYVRRADVAGDRNIRSSVLYFGCLGLGFMAFELPAIQVMTLFLGHPTYALSVVLLGLLAAAGVGSTLMGRIPNSWGPKALLGIVALAVASWLGLLAGVHAFIDQPDAVRFGVTLLYVFAIGVPLGMPFVSGIRLLPEDRPHQVAWAWAANGASAVIGSCLLMILMVWGGSGAAFAVAAVCYALAWVARGRLASTSAAMSSGG